MQRIERLVAVNEALRRAAPGTISARRLAEEFGVARRTIERDLVALRSAGLPLYSESGRHGGAASLDQLGSAIVALSAGEAMALLTAIAAAGPSMPFVDAGKSAVTRILDALPPTTRIATEQLRDRMRTLEETVEPANRRIRRTIEGAVRRGVVVNIRYQDLEGAVTERSVDAVGFLRHTGGWYLIGWCHLRQGSRLFHLNQIQRANLTRERSEERDVDETLGWVPATVTRP